MSKAILSIVPIFDASKKMKICSKCKIEKPYSAYSKNKDRKIGILPACKKCRNEGYKDPRGGSNKSRPDKVLRYYGVTYEHVVRTLDAQHCMCANKACGKKISLDAPRGLGKAFIDHDHATGKFRGLLCMMCNLTLGKIENERHIVLGLMDYITKHS